MPRGSRGASRLALFVVIAAPLSVVAVGGGPALAGTLRGTLVFPPVPRGGDARPLANWRLENNVLPIAPPPAETRHDVVLVLDPEKPAPPPPEGTDPPKVEVEAKPLVLEPHMLIARTGTVFAIKNSDRIDRNLYLRDGESFFPHQAQAPGKDRTVRFTVPGEYAIVDAENPRAGATLVVVASPYFSRADDRGGFVIEAPEGHYQLRAYFHGQWTTPIPVEVGRGRDVTLKLPAERRPAADAREGN
jgi:hypothetical protein